MSEQPVTPEDTVFLTMRRMPNGMMQPFIDGKRVVGCYGVNLASDLQQGVLSLNFTNACVFYDTAKLPGGH